MRQLAPARETARRGMSDVTYESSISFFLKLPDAPNPKRVACNTTARQPHDGIAANREAICDLFIVEENLLSLQLDIKIQRAQNARHRSGR